MKFKRSAFGYRSADVEDYIDELAERHEVELEHKDIEIRRLKSALDQAQLRAQESESASTRLRDVEAHNSDLSTRLADAQSEFGRLKADLSAMDALLRGKDATVQESQSQISGLRSQLADLPRLEAMLAERDRLLGQAETEAHAAKRDVKLVEDLKLAIEDKENVIEELNSRVVTLEEALARQADELSLSEAAPSGDAGTGVLVGDTAVEPFTSGDDISDYLSQVTLDLGQVALQKNPVEYQRFRAMAGALREHLSSLNSELGTYRQQEKAIAQALIKAQLTAAEIETDALSQTIKRKAVLIEELESGKTELELTKKTTQKFKNDLASVLENYKKRLISFDAPQASALEDDQSGGQDEA